MEIKERYCKNGCFNDVSDACDIRGHNYNYKRIGYVHGVYPSGTIWFECHYSLNEQEIGCEQIYKELINAQFFYNKPGKKFGEQITWK